MPSKLVPTELRQSIIRAATIASRSGLMPANQGNLSARDRDSGLIAITPHDRPYDLMSPDDLVVVDSNGVIIDGGSREPSYDLPVHRTVYRQRPDVHAVVHTEPPYVNALGALGLEIDAVTTTGLKSANGSVPIMPFRALRDDAFAAEMLALMGERFAVVWGSHGLLVVGASVEQALERSLGVEYNAQVYVIARRLGQPHSLAYLDAAMILA